MNWVGCWMWLCSFINGMEDVLVVSSVLVFIVGLSVWYRLCLVLVFLMIVLIIRLVMVMLLLVRLVLSCVVMVGCLFLFFIFLVNSVCVCFIVGLMKCCLWFCRVMLKFL